MYFHSSILFFLSSHGLLEHYLEFAFDLSVVFFSVSLCIDFLKWLLQTLYHISATFHHWCQHFTILREVWKPYLHLGLFTFSFLQYNLLKYFLYVILRSTSMIQFVLQPLNIIQKTLYCSFFIPDAPSFLFCV